MKPSAFDLAYLRAENAKHGLALKEIPRDRWPGNWKPSSLLEVWRSRDFLVQIYSEPRADSPARCRLSANRTSVVGDQWEQGISWDDLQRLKSEAGFGAYDAVEIYPRDYDVVNVANMRHLWILRDFLTFGWSGDGASRNA